MEKKMYMRLNDALMGIDEEKIEGAFYVPFNMYPCRVHVERKAHYIEFKFEYIGITFPEYQDRYSIETVMEQDFDAPYEYIYEGAEEETVRHWFYQTQSCGMCDVTGTGLEINRLDRREKKAPGIAEFVTAIEAITNSEKTDPTKPFELDYIVRGNDVEEMVIRAELPEKAISLAYRTIFGGAIGAMSPADRRRLGEKHDLRCEGARL